jgi:hypothetical protein
MTGHRTFWGLQHHRYHASKHSDSQQAYLLVFADLAEFSDADSEISKGTVLNDLGEVFLIQSGNDFKR